MWSFLESVGLLSVQLIIGIMLARILFPEQFGLIGMLAIFMAVAQAFLDSGFGAALIQKQDATQTDICSVFYFNIIIGVLIALLLCVAAPLIAAFYEQPILTSLTRVLSLTLVINAFGLIQHTILRKEIDFRTQTLVSLAASALSGIAGISLAAAGYGIWSLAAQQVSAALFRTFFLWFACTWRPTLTFSLVSLVQLFGYGSKLLAAGLLNQIFSNIYLLVIGKIFSAADLGYYTRAKSLAVMPSTAIPGMVSRVMFPVFSKIQNEPVRLKSGMKKALNMLVLVYFPLMIGLAATARPLVLLLLTEKWAPSVPYLQLLCFAWLLYPMQLINLNILQALGRSDLFLRLEIIKKVLIVANILLTWRWGIQAMIAGMVVTSVFAYLLNSYYTAGLIGYSIGEQLRDLLPCLALSLCMGAAVAAIGLLALSSEACRLMLQIFTGTVGYIMLCRLLRIRAFMDVWTAGRNKLYVLNIIRP